MGSRRTSFIPHWFGGSRDLSDTSEGGPIRAAQDSQYRTRSSEHGMAPSVFRSEHYDTPLQEILRSGLLCPHRRSSWGFHWSLTRHALPPTCLPPSLCIIFFQFHRKFWKIVLFPQWNCFGVTHVPIRRPRQFIAFDWQRGRGWESFLWLTTSPLGVTCVIAPGKSNPK